MSRESEQTLANTSAGRASDVSTANSSSGASDFLLTPGKGVIVDPCYILRFAREDYLDLGGMVMAVGNAIDFRSAMNAEDFVRLAVQKGVDQSISSMDQMKKFLDSDCVKRIKNWKKLGYSGCSSQWHNRAK